MATQGYNSKSGLTPDEYNAQQSAAASTNYNPNVITSDSLTPQTPITPVQPYIPPVPDVKGLDATPPALPTPQDTKASDLATQIQNLNNRLIGRSEFKTQQETAQGIPELQKTQTDLASQLKSIQNEAQAIPLQLQNEAAGRGITAGGLAPLQTARLRTNAIQALGISSLLEASRGNLATAQSLVDRAVAARFDPIKEEIAAKTANLDLILKDPNTTIQEKNRAQLQKDIQDQKARDLEKQKENAKTGQALAVAALKNNPDDPTASFNAQQVLKLDPTSPTYLSDAFNLVGKYQANLIEYQQAKLGLTKTQAEINKLNSDAQTALATGDAVSTPVLQGMLNVYKSTGVLPAFGMSAKSPLRAQFYAALGSPEGAGMVNEANTNKSIRAGLATAYRTQQNLLSANQTAIGTLDQQLNLAKSYSDKISRAGSPFVNKYLLQAKSGVFGDPDTAAFNNIVKTASYEFAKILSGAAASIAGVTVSSYADAENMLNTALTKGQFNEVIGLMQKEANFRLNSQKEVLGKLQKDMNNVGKLTEDLKNSGTTQLHGPDGNLYDVPNDQVGAFKKAGGY
jgi:hypothetical protein